MACGLYLRGSLRGLLLFVGILGCFFYKYVLWTFDWAYNPLYLIYVVLFSGSLWTLVLVLRGIDGEQIRAAIGERFSGSNARHLLLRDRRSAVVEVSR